MLRRCVWLIGLGAALLLSMVSPVIAQSAMPSARENHATCLFTPGMDPTKSIRYIELHDTGDRCITQFPIDSTDVVETYDNNWLLIYTSAQDAQFNENPNTVVKKVYSGRISLKQNKAWDVTLASGTELKAGGPYEIYRPGSDYEKNMNPAGNFNRAVVIHDGQEYLHDGIMALTVYDNWQCVTCTWDLLMQGSPLSNNPGAQVAVRKGAWEACNDSYQKACESQVDSDLKLCKQDVDGGKCKVGATIPNNLTVNGDPVVVHSDGTCDEDGLYGIPVQTGSCADMICKNPESQNAQYCQNGQLTFGGDCTNCLNVNKLIGCQFGSGWNASTFLSFIPPSNADYQTFLNCVQDRENQYQARSDCLTRREQGQLTQQELQNCQDPNKGCCPKADGCNSWDSGADSNIFTNSEIAQYYDPNTGQIIYVNADGGNGQCNVQGQDYSSVKGKIQELIKCAAEGGFSMNKEIHRWSDRANGGEYDTGLTGTATANIPIIGPLGIPVGFTSINIPTTGGPLDPMFGYYSPREAAIMPHIDPDPANPDPTKCPYMDQVTPNMLPNPLGTGEIPMDREDCIDSPWYDPNSAYAHSVYGPNPPAKPNVQNPLKCVKHYLERFICQDKKGIDTTSLDSEIQLGIKNDTTGKFCLYVNRPIGCPATTETNGDSWSNTPDPKTTITKSIQDKRTASLKCAKELYAWGTEASTRLFDTIDGGEFAANYFEGAFVGNDKAKLPSILDDCRYRGAGWLGDGKALADKGNGQSTTLTIQTSDLPDRDQGDYGLDGQPGPLYNKDTYGLCRFLISTDDDKRIAGKDEQAQNTPAAAPVTGCMSQFGAQDLDSSSAGDLQGDINNMKFNVIGDMLNEYKCIMNRITEAMMVPVTHLFWLMVSIEMAWAFVLWNMTGRDLQSLIGNLTQRILWIGMMAAIIQGTQGGFFGAMTTDWTPIGTSPYTNWITLVPQSFDAVGQMVLANGGITHSTSVWVQVSVETLTVLGIMILDYFMVQPVDFVPLINLIHVWLRSIFFMPTITTILICAGMILYNYMLCYIELYIAVGVGCVFLGLMGTRWTFTFFSTYFAYSFSTAIKILINYIVCYIYIKIMDDLAKTILVWMAARYAASTFDLTGIIDLVLYGMVNLQITGLLAIMSYAVNMVPRLATVVAGATPGAGSGGEVIGNASHIVNEGMTRARTAVEEHMKASSGSSGAEHGGEIEGGGEEEESAGALLSAAAMGGNSRGGRIQDAGTSSPHGQEGGEEGRVEPPPRGEDEEEDGQISSAHAPSAARSEDEDEGGVHPEEEGGGSHSEDESEDGNADVPEAEEENGTVRTNPDDIEASPQAFGATGAAGASGDREGAIESRPEDKENQNRGGERNAHSGMRDEESEESPPEQSQEDQAAVDAHSGARDTAPASVDKPETAEVAVSEQSGAGLRSGLGTAHIASRVGIESTRPDTDGLSDEHVHDAHSDSKDRASGKGVSVAVGRVASAGISGMSGQSGTKGQYHAQSSPKSKQVGFKSPRAVLKKQKAPSQARILGHAVSSQPSQESRRPNATQRSEGGMSRRLEQSTPSSSIASQHGAPRTSATPRVVGKVTSVNQVDVHVQTGSAQGGQHEVSDRQLQPVARGKSHPEAQRVHKSRELPSGETGTKSVQGKGLESKKSAGSDRMSVLEPQTSSQTNRAGRGQSHQDGKRPAEPLHDVERGSSLGAPTKQQRSESSTVGSVIVSHSTQESRQQHAATRPGAVHAERLSSSSEVVLHQGSSSNPNPKAVGRVASLPQLATHSTHQPEESRQLQPVARGKSHSEARQVHRSGELLSGETGPKSVQRKELEPKKNAGSDRTPVLEPQTSSQTNRAGKGQSHQDGKRPAEPLHDIERGSPLEAPKKQQRSESSTIGTVIVSHSTQESRQQHAATRSGTVHAERFSSSSEVVSHPGSSAGPKAVGRVASLPQLATHSQMGHQSGESRQLQPVARGRQEERQAENGGLRTGGRIIRSADDTFAPDYSPERSVQRHSSESHSEVTTAHTVVITTGKPVSEHEAKRLVEEAQRLTEDAKRLTEEAKNIAHAATKLNPAARTPELPDIGSMAQRASVKDGLKAVAKDLFTLGGFGLSSKPRQVMKSSTTVQVFGGSHVSVQHHEVQPVARGRGSQEAHRSENGELRIGGRIIKSADDTFAPEYSPERSVQRHASGTSSDVTTAHTVVITGGKPVSGHEAKRLAEEVKRLTDTAKEMTDRAARLSQLASTHQANERAGTVSFHTSSSSARHLGQVTSVHRFETHSHTSSVEGGQVGERQLQPISREGRRQSGSGEQRPEHSPEHPFSASSSHLSHMSHAEDGDSGDLGDRIAASIRRVIGKERVDRLIGEAEKRYEKWEKDANGDEDALKVKMLQGVFGNRASKVGIGLIDVGVRSIISINQMRGEITKEEAQQQLQEHKANQGKFKELLKNAPKQDDGEESLLSVALREIRGNNADDQSLVGVARELISGIRKDVLRDDEDGEPLSRESLEESRRIEEEMLGDIRGILGIPEESTHMSSSGGLRTRQSEADVRTEAQSRGSENRDQHQDQQSVTQSQDVHGRPMRSESNTVGSVIPVTTQESRLEHAAASRTSMHAFGQERVSLQGESSNPRAIGRATSLPQLPTHRSSSVHSHTFEMASHQFQPAARRGSVPEVRQSESRELRMGGKVIRSVDDDFFAPKYTPEHPVSSMSTHQTHDQSQAGGTGARDSRHEEYPLSDIQRATLQALEDSKKYDLGDRIAASIRKVVGKERVDRLIGVAEERYQKWEHEANGDQDALTVKMFQGVFGNRASRVGIGLIDVGVRSIISINQMRGEITKEEAQKQLQEHKANQGKFKELLKNAPPKNDGEESLLSVALKEIRGHNADDQSIVGIARELISGIRRDVLRDDEDGEPLSRESLAERQRIEEEMLGDIKGILGIQEEGAHGSSSDGLGSRRSETDGRVEAQSRGTENADQREGQPSAVQSQRTVQRQRRPKPVDVGQAGSSLRAQEEEGQSHTQSAVRHSQNAIQSAEGNVPGAVERLASQQPTHSRPRTVGDTTTVLPAASHSRISSERENPQEELQLQPVSMGASGTRSRQSESREQRPEHSRVEGSSVTERNDNTTGDRGSDESGRVDQHIPVGERSDHPLIARAQETIERAEAAILASRAVRNQSARVQEEIEQADSSLSISKHELEIAQRQLEQLRVGTEAEEEHEDIAVILARRNRLLDDRAQGALDLAEAAIARIREATERGDTRPEEQDSHSVQLEGREQRPEHTREEDSSVTERNDNTPGDRGSDESVRVDHGLPPSDRSDDDAGGGNTPPSAPGGGHMPAGVDGAGSGRIEHRSNNDDPLKQAIRGMIEKGIEDGIKDLNAERVAEGLPAISGGEFVKVIEDKIKGADSQIAHINGLLAPVGGVAATPIEGELKKINKDFHEMQAERYKQAQGELRRNVASAVKKLAEQYVKDESKGKIGAAADDQRSLDQQLNASLKDKNVSKTVRYGRQFGTELAQALNNFERATGALATEHLDASIRESATNLLKQNANIRTAIENVANAANPHDRKVAEDALHDLIRTELQAPAGGAAGAAGGVLVQLHAEVQAGGRLHNTELGKAMGDILGDEKRMDEFVKTTAKEIVSAARALDLRSVPPAAPGDAAHVAAFKTDERNERIDSVINAQSTAARKQADGMKKELSGDAIHGFFSAAPHTEKSVYRYLRPQDAGKVIARDVKKGGKADGRAEAAWNSKVIENGRFAGRTGAQAHNEMVAELEELEEKRKAIEAELNAENKLREQVEELKEKLEDVSTQQGLHDFQVEMANIRQSLQDAEANLLHDAQETAAGFGGPGGVPWGPGRVRADVDGALGVGGAVPLGMANLPALPAGTASHVHEATRKALAARDIANANPGDREAEKRADALEKKARDLADKADHQFELHARVQQDNVDKDAALTRIAASAAATAAGGGGVGAAMPGAMAGAVPGVGAGHFTVAPGTAVHDAKAALIHGLEAEISRLKESESDESAAIRRAELKSKLEETEDKIRDATFVLEALDTAREKLSTQGHGWKTRAYTVARLPIGLLLGGFKAGAGLLVNTIGKPIDALAHRGTAGYQPLSIFSGEGTNQHRLFGVDRLGIGSVSKTWQHALMPSDLRSPQKRMNHILEREMHRVEVRSEEAKAARRAWEDSSKGMMGMHRRDQDPDATGFRRLWEPVRAPFASGAERIGAVDLPGGRENRLMLHQLEGEIRNELAAAPAGAIPAGAVGQAAREQAYAVHLNTQTNAARVALAAAAPGAAAAAAQTRLEDAQREQTEWQLKLKRRDATESGSGKAMRDYAILHNEIEAARVKRLENKILQDRKEVATINDQLADPATPAANIPVLNARLGVLNARLDANHEDLAQRQVVKEDVEAHQQRLSDIRRAVANAGIIKIKIAGINRQLKDSNTSATQKTLLEKELKGYQKDLDEMRSIPGLDANLFSTKSDKPFLNVKEKPFGLALALAFAIPTGGGSLAVYALGRFGPKLAHRAPPVAYELLKGVGSGLMGSRRGADKHFDRAFSKLAGTSDLAQSHERQRQLNKALRQARRDINYETGLYSINDSTYRRINDLHAEYAALPAAGRTAAQQARFEAIPGEIENLRRQPKYRSLTSAVLNTHPRKATTGDHSKRVEIKRAKNRLEESREEAVVTLDPATGARRVRFEDRQERLEKEAKAKEAETEGYHGLLDIARNPSQTGPAGARVFNQNEQRERLRDNRIMQELEAEISECHRQLGVAGGGMPAGWMGHINPAAPPAAIPAAVVAARDFQDRVKNHNKAVFEYQVLERNPKGLAPDKLSEQLKERYIDILKCRRELEMPENPSMVTGAPGGGWRNVMAVPLVPPVGLNAAQTADLVRRHNQAVAKFNSYRGLENDPAGAAAAAFHAAEDRAAHDREQITIQKLARYVRVENESLLREWQDYTIRKAQRAKFSDETYRRAWKRFRRGEWSTHNNDVEHSAARLIEKQRDGLREGIAEHLADLNQLYDMRAILINRFERQGQRKVSEIGGVAGAGGLLGQARAISGLAGPLTPGQRVQLALRRARLERAQAELNHIKYQFEHQTPVKALFASDTSPKAMQRVHRHKTTWGGGPVPVDSTRGLKILTPSHHEAKEILYPNRDGRMTGQEATATAHYVAGLLLHATNNEAAKDLRQMRRYRTKNETARDELGRISNSMVYECAANHVGAGALLAMLAALPPAPLVVPPGEPLIPGTPPGVAIPVSHVTENLDQWRDPIAGAPNPNRALYDGFLALMTPEDRERYESTRGERTRIEKELNDRETGLNVAENRNLAYQGARATEMRKVAESYHDLISLDDNGNVRRDNVNWFGAGRLIGAAKPARTLGHQIRKLPHLGWVGVKIGWKVVHGIPRVLGTGLAAVGLGALAGAVTAAIAVPTVGLVDVAMHLKRPLAAPLGTAIAAGGLWIGSVVLTTLSPLTLCGFLGRLAVRRAFYDPTLRAAYNHTVDPAAAGISGASRLFAHTIQYTGRSVALYSVIASGGPLPSGTFFTVPVGVAGLAVLGYKLFTRSNLDPRRAKTWNEAMHATMHGRWGAIVRYTAESASMIAGAANGVGERIAGLSRQLDQEGDRFYLGSLTPRLVGAAVFGAFAGTIYGLDRHARLPRLPRVGPVNLGALGRMDLGLRTDFGVRKWQRYRDGQTNKNEHWMTDGPRVVPAAAGGNIVTRQYHRYENWIGTRNENWRQTARLQQSRIQREGFVQIARAEHTFKSREEEIKRIKKELPTGDDGKLSSEDQARVDRLNSFNTSRRDAVKKLVLKSVTEGVNNTSVLKKSNRDDPVAAPAGAGAVAAAAVASGAPAPGAGGALPRNIVRERVQQLDEVFRLITADHEMAVIQDHLVQERLKELKKSSKDSIDDQSSSYVRERMALRVYNEELPAAGPAGGASRATVDGWLGAVAGRTMLGALATLPPGAGGVNYHQNALNRAEAVLVKTQEVTRPVIAKQVFNELTPADKATAETWLAGAPAGTTRTLFDALAQVPPPAAGDPYQERVLDRIEVAVNRAKARVEEGRVSYYKEQADALEASIKEGGSAMQYLEKLTTLKDQGVWKERLGKVGYIFSNIAPEGLLAAAAASVTSPGALFATMGGGGTAIASGLTMGASFTLVGGGTLVFVGGLGSVATGVTYGATYAASGIKRIAMNTYRRIGAFTLARVGPAPAVAAAGFRAAAVARLRAAATAVAATPVVPGSAAGSAAAAAGPLWGGVRTGVTNGLAAAGAGIHLGVDIGRHIPDVVNGGWEVGKGVSRWSARVAGIALGLGSMAKHAAGHGVARSATRAWRWLDGQPQPVYGETIGDIANRKGQHRYEAVEKALRAPDRKARRAVHHYAHWADDIPEVRTPQGSLSGNYMAHQIKRDARAKAYAATRKEHLGDKGMKYRAIKADHLKVYQRNLQAIDATAEEAWRQAVEQIEAELRATLLARLPAPVAAPLGVAALPGAWRLNDEQRKALKSATSMQKLEEVLNDSLFTVAAPRAAGVAVGPGHVPVMLTDAEKKQIIRINKAREVSTNFKIHRQQMALQHKNHMADMRIDRDSERMVRKRIEKWSNRLEGHWETVAGAERVSEEVALANPAAHRHVDGRIQAFEESGREVEIRRYLFDLAGEVATRGADGTFRRVGGLIQVPVPAGTYRVPGGGAPVPFLQYHVDRLTSLHPELAAQPAAAVQALVARLYAEEVARKYYDDIRADQLNPGGGPGIHQAGLNAQLLAHLNSVLAGSGAQATAFLGTLNAQPELRPRTGARPDGYTHEADMAQRRAQIETAVLFGDSIEYQRWGENRSWKKVSGKWTSHLLTGALEVGVVGTAAVFTPFVALGSAIRHRNRAQVAAETTAYIRGAHEVVQNYGSFVYRTGITSAAALGNAIAAGIATPVVAAYSGMKYRNWNLNGNWNAGRIFGFTVGVDRLIERATSRRAFNNDQHTVPAAAGAASAASVVATAGTYVGTLGWRTVHRGARWVGAAATAHAAPIAPAGAGAGPYIRYLGSRAMRRMGAAIGARGAPLGGPTSAQRAVNVWNWFGPARAAGVNIAANPTNQSGWFRPSRPGWEAQRGREGRTPGLAAGAPDPRGTPQPRAYNGNLRGEDRSVMVPNTIPHPDPVAAAAGAVVENPQQGMPVRRTDRVYYTHQDPTRRLNSEHYKNALRIAKAATNEEYKIGSRFTGRYIKYTGLFLPGLMAHAWWRDGGGTQRTPLEKLRDGAQNTAVAVASTAVGAVTVPFALATAPVVFVGNTIANVGRALAYGESRMVGREFRGVVKGVTTAAHYLTLGMVPKVNMRYKEALARNRKAAIDAISEDRLVFPELPKRKLNLFRPVRSFSDNSVVNRVLGVTSAIGRVDEVFVHTQDKYEDSLAARRAMHRPRAQAAVNAVVSAVRDAASTAGGVAAGAAANRAADAAASAVPVGVPTHVSDTATDIAAVARFAAGLPGANANTVLNAVVAAAGGPGVVPVGAPAVRALPVIPANNQSPHDPLPLPHLNDAAVAGAVVVNAAGIASAAPAMGAGGAPLPASPVNNAIRREVRNRSDEFWDDIFYSMPSSTSLRQARANFLEEWPRMSPGFRLNAKLKEHNSFFEAENFMTHLADAMAELATHVKSTNAWYNTKPQNALVNPVTTPNPIFIFPGDNG